MRSSHAAILLDHDLGYTPRPIAPPHNDFDAQLRLAGQIQRELLPEPLADTSPLRVSTLYLPADHVSGDVYDLARLGDHLLSVSIADATGHGLPAALLSLSLRGLLAQRPLVGSPPLEPDELLSRLNTALMSAHLSGCQFITALSALFDGRTGELRWSRGGGPYPLLVRRGRPAELLTSEGALLGEFEQTFQIARRTLEPGDVVVLYTDGLEALLLDGSERQSHSLAQTMWAGLLADQGEAAALDYIRVLAATMPSADWPRDDITAIILRMA